MKNMKKKGFTLVELLVVIAIIAILATVSVIGYTAFLTKANESNATTEAKQVEQAIESELMAGDDYVIGEVVTPASTDAEGNEIPAVTDTYVVKVDGKVYKNDTLYTGDLTAAFDANADFAALNGTFAVDGNGVITYTYTDGSTATIKFN